MATTTTNFGWDIPQSTDLVKDGATAIAALGQDIDTALVDLKGGTTGQVLAKATNTDLDFTWVAQDDSNAIQNAIVDAKGDLITATANDTPARLGVGTDGQILTADSSTATGIKWASPAASGGMTLLTTTTLSGTSTTTASFATTYKELVCHFYGLNTSASNEIRLRVNSNTGNNYGMAYLGDANTSLTQDNATSGLRVVDYFATVPGYAVGKISIPQYGNTSLTSKSCFVTQTNTSARRMISIGYITETTAISTLTFYSTSTISGTVLIYGVN